MAEGAYTREFTGRAAPRRRGEERGGGGVSVGKGVHHFDGVRVFRDVVVVGPVGVWSSRARLQSAFRTM